MKEKKDRFLIAKRSSEGECTEPQLHRIEDMDGEWTMKRRDFLKTAAVGAAALSAHSIFGSAAAYAQKAAPAGKNPKAAIPHNDPLIKAHEYDVTMLRLTPDKKRLISVSSVIDEGSTVKYWSMENLSLEKTFTVPFISSCMSNADGSVLTIGNTEGKISYWKTSPPEKTGEISFYKSEEQISIYASDDASVFAADGYITGITLWKAEGKEPILRIKTNCEMRQSISLSGDKTRLALSGEKRQEYRQYGSTMIRSIPTIAIHDCSTGKEIKRISDIQGGILAVSFSPDGKTIAALTLDRDHMKGWKSFVYVFSCETGKPLKKILMPFSSANDAMLSFVPDGTKIAVLCYGNLKMIDLQTDALSEPYRTDPDVYEYIKTFVITASGKEIIAGLGSGQIAIQDIADPMKRTCLLDPKEMLAGHEAVIVSAKDASGKTVTSVLPAGTAIAEGSVCTCNTVKGSFTPRGGGSCSHVCVCVPVK